MPTITTKDMKQIYQAAKELVISRPIWSESTDG